MEENINFSVVETASVCEYLILGYLCMGDSRVFNKSVAGTFRINACLTYALQIDQHDWVNVTTAKHYPLLEYAAQHWIHYAV